MTTACGTANGRVTVKNLPEEPVSNTVHEAEVADVCALRHNDVVYACSCSSDETIQLLRLNGDELSKSEGEFVREEMRSFRPCDNLQVQR